MGMARMWEGQRLKCKVGMTRYDNDNESDGDSGNDQDDTGIDMGMASM